MRLNSLAASVSVVLILALAGAAGAQSVERSLEDATEATPILVSYDFETAPDSGPDTFRLFERRRGQVRLSDAFRVSGAQSLRLDEGAGDGSFTEFLGFFPRRSEGVVLMQFYLLFSDPSQVFNFALAGDRWFLSRELHGHAFWLATEDGMLRHCPGGEWRDLFAPQPFLWYFVDLLYEIDRGAYHLAIYEEGREEPLVRLDEERNYNDLDESAVRYYSFIGDLEDEGWATIFVDDLLIATDPKVRLKPVVAPGRRSFFVERYQVEIPRGEDPETAEAQARLQLRRGELFPGAEPLAGRGNVYEAVADAAFLAGDLDLAEELYGLLREDPERAVRVLLKLADVHHLRGEAQAERSLREAIYGRLD